MKVLKIIKCNDPMLWYSEFVGKFVPYIGMWPECFKSREKAGYVNIVNFEDADLIEMNNDVEFY